jgi:DNA-binding CsgD family transcriptional regulator
MSASLVWVTVHAVVNSASVCHHVFLLKVTFAGGALGEIEQLLGPLYDGVMSSDGFQCFVKALCQFGKLKAVVLCTRNARTQETRGLWLHGMTMEWMERYAMEYAGEDVLASHIAAAPIARFYASNLDVPDSERFPDNRFYREWIVAQGLAYAAGGVVLREGPWDTQLFLQRAPEHGPFTRDEIARFDRLISHLQRAIQMRQRFIECSLGLDVLSKGLDLLTMAAFLFDENTRIVGMNRSAHALVSTGDNLRVLGGHLLASHTQVSRKISYELTRAVHAGSGEERSNGLVLLPRLGRLPLMMVVAPLRTERHEDGPLSAVLFAFDPERVPTATAAMLRELFSLSAAEAELAAALCSGKTLADAALARGTTLNTSRTQLKSIFSKTGTRRQSDLVSLLLASPAYFFAELGAS